MIHHLKLKTLLPVVLALLGIALFTGLIIKHERHFQKGQSVYVKLQPVDPRSILQGDYMVLNYDLNFHDVDEQQIQNQAKLVTYVYLDAKRRVLETRLNEHLAVKSTKPIKLVLKNPRNQLDALYPAANSFLFAEGLEPCYSNAEYAHLRVKSNGQALLAALVDQDLKSLNCEQQQKWSDAANEKKS